MPTLFDPVADIGEAADVMNGLARSSLNFANPQDIFGVLGDKFALIPLM